MAEAVRLLVSTVVVQATCQVQDDLGTCGLDDLTVEVVEVRTGVLGIALSGGSGVGRAEDNAVPGFDLGGDLLREVAQLGLVDEGAELDVHAPEPPAMRELEGKVASALARPPSSDPVLPTEDAVKAHEAVVPVMSAGNGEEQRMFLVSTRQRCPVRTKEAVLVLAATAHDEDPSAFRHVSVILGVQLDLLGGKERGHGVGGIPSVDQVGHIVEP